MTMELRNGDTRRHCEESTDEASNKVLPLPLREGEGSSPLHS
jgi:hypothetical protein